MEQILFAWNGNPVAAEPGDTVASACIARGSAPLLTAISMAVGEVCFASPDLAQPAWVKRWMGAQRAQLHPAARKAVGFIAKPECLTAGFDSPG